MITEDGRGQGVAGGEPGGRELADVADRERWERVVDLAEAQDSEADLAGGDEGRDEA